MPAKDLVFNIIGVDKASDKFDKVGDAADRMGGRAAKVVAALAGASVASSAAITGALVGLPVLFAGIGAAALAQNARVRGSFADLSNTVRTGLTADAAPLEESFVGAAEKIGAAYERLRPQLGTMFESSRYAVEALTDGVTGLAEGAMPGLVVAAQSSGPALRGVESLFVSTGRGAGEFFEVIAGGAPAAGQGIAALGDIAEGVLPNVAGLVVGLTNVWAEHGDQAARVVVRLTGVMEDLGGGALPVVSSAMGVALDVLEGALAVVGPLADQLGPLVGIWLAVATGMRAVGAVSGVVAGLTTAVTNFRVESERAGSPGAGASRLVTVSRGLMSTLGGPFGLVVAAAGIGLAMFGQKSQDAANDQRELAQALKESSGAFDDNARRTLFNSKAYKEISDEVAGAGLTHDAFIDAIISGGPALDGITAKLRDQSKAIVTRSQAAGEFISTESVTYGEATSQSLKLLYAIEGLRSQVTGAEADMQREREAVADATAAMVGATPGADALSEAMNTLGDETATTADRVDALETAWRRLFGTGISLDEAVGNWEEGLDGIRESLTEVKDGVTTVHREMVTAAGVIDLTTEAGRALQGSLIDQGAAYRELAQTSYDTALQQGSSQLEATRAAERSVAERRKAFRDEMIDLGFTAAQVDVLARKYLGLPDQVITLIKADPAAAQTEVDRFIRDNSGRIISVRVQTSSGPAVQPVAPGKPNQPIGLPMRARGGLERAGEWELVGEEGMELRVPKQDGMILPADHTRQILSALAAGRRSTGTPVLASAGGSRSVHVHHTVQYELPNTDGLIREIAKGLRVFIRDTSGGSVEGSLGS